LTKHLSKDDLTLYGWNNEWAVALEQERSGRAAMKAGRVVAQHSKHYQIITEAGERIAAVTGKFEFAASDRSDFPAVGDWVAAELLEGEARAVIHNVLPRRTALIRKEAGARSDGQVIGANVDVLFIVNSLNEDFNLRKIERYLIAAWESGANPVILLTKADLCANAEEYIALAEGIAPGVPVHAVSAQKQAGKELLEQYLLPGVTAAIVGSSGVGKSTLLNWLAGDERQAVQAIREDDARGRHTTTHRQLFLLESGALLMDTPGMRELQLWESDRGWGAAFADIEELAAACRYRDCSHSSELGCAIQEALDSGALDAERYANYLKTQRELARLVRKEQSSANQRAKKNGKRSKEEARIRKERYNYGQE